MRRITTAEILSDAASLPADTSQVEWVIADESEALIAHLTGALENAWHHLVEVYNRTECIGLGSTHVDGNCLHCLSFHGAQAAYQKLSTSDLQKLLKQREREQAITEAARELVAASKPYPHAKDLTGPIHRLEIALQKRDELDAGERK